MQGAQSGRDRFGRPALMHQFSAHPIVQPAALNQLGARPGNPPSPSGSPRADAPPRSRYGSRGRGACIVGPSQHPMPHGPGVLHFKLEAKRSRSWFEGRPLPGNAWRLTLTGRSPNCRSGRSRVLSCQWRSPAHSVNRFTALGTPQTQRVGRCRSRERKTRPQADLCNKAVYWCRCCRHSRTARRSRAPECRRG